MQHQYRTNSKFPGWLKILLILMIAWIVADILGISPFRQSRVELRPVTQPEGNLGADEMATMDVFRRISSSVVYITNKRFQRNIFSFTVKEIPQGTGSGFLWDDMGHIVTNFHVIYKAHEIEVTLQNGKSYDAHFVGADPDHDIAVLQINPKNLDIPPVMIGSSKDLQVGQKVLAIGNPFGLDSTLTTGIISALGRTIQSMTERYIYDVIQTDAAINPGNSGGPLLDSFGRLIGMNTAIISPSGSYAGIGFAVPVDTINRVATKLINTGKVERPGLGVTLIPDRIMSRLGFEGVGILHVDKGSSAEAAGLKATVSLPDGRVKMGDVITRCDDTEIKNEDDLVKVLDRYDVGDEVELAIIRGNSKITKRVILQSMN